jgi:glycosyltransferase involved in cell wall biosynthesis
MLHKDIPQDYDRLCDILYDTHFLLHPTEFEAFGIAMVEANAFGVPVLATNVYGPKTIIRYGINGSLFERDEYIEGATSFIMRFMDDIDEYRSLALSSLKEYISRFTWTMNARKLLEILSNSENRYASIPEI